MFISGVNLFHVLIATIASFIFGWLWYGPVFGKKWMKLMNFTKKSFKSMKIKPVTAMVLGFISTFVLALVLAQLLEYLSTGTIGYGLKIGFWIWLGFIATTTLGGSLWEGKSFNLWTFNNIYHLINIEIIATVLSVW